MIIKLDNIFKKLIKIYLKKLLKNLKKYLKLHPNFINNFIISPKWNFLKNFSKNKINLFLTNFKTPSSFNLNNLKLPSIHSNNLDNTKINGMVKMTLAMIYINVHLPNYPIIHNKLPIEKTSKIMQLNTLIFHNNILKSTTKK